MDSFFSKYIQYVGESEVPTSYTRWSAIVGIGSLLDKSTWIEFGTSQIYSNQYVMLIGSAGARKGTAIKGVKKILSNAGVENFSAERTSKEKFLMDLSGEEEGPFVHGMQDNILERNLGFTDPTSTTTHPMNIYVDEANDFFGHGNIEFLSILGSLWDWPTDTPYQNRIKTGKSISISSPSVSIIAGNTPTGFATGFPPEIIGQGFFSRLLLVYGEPNGKRITFPRTPSVSETAEIVKEFQRVRMDCSGALGFTDTAERLLDNIYKGTVNSADSRFDSYFNRRFTHLLKLCIICAASRHVRVISESVVIESNTYLTYIESLMPKALGEFGRARNSDVTHKILSLIEAHDGVTLKQIMKCASADLDKTSDIGDILRKLSGAEKIISAGGLFLPVRGLRLSDKTKYIDLAYLTEEELSVGG